MYGRAAVSLLILVSILLFIIAGLFLELKDSRKIINCDSFSSYKEALKALPSNPKLDLDHDGKPCESKFNIK